MKKILLWLSLLIIALFVISCTPKESADGEEEALAGQAYTTKQCALTAKQWGFIQKSDVNLICEDIIVAPEEESLTGYQFCQQHDFDACSTIITKMSTTYFSSTDKSCSGNAQYYSVDFFSLPCEANPLSLNPVAESKGFGCIIEKPTNAVELLYGDTKFENKGQQVVCCRIE